LEIVSPKLGKHCPAPKVEGDISPTEGKQFPIVTDNDNLCFVIPHSNMRKYEYSTNNQRANNDVMDSRCIIMMYLLFGFAQSNQISFGNKSVFECGYI